MSSKKWLDVIPFDAFNRMLTLGDSCIAKIKSSTSLLGSAIVYEFSGAEDRAVYLGLANTLPGLVGALAPLLGGLLGSFFGYPVMFALSAAMALAGWAVYRFGVSDPRHSPKTT